MTVEGSNAAKNGSHMGHVIGIYTRNYGDMSHISPRLQSSLLCLNHVIGTLDFGHIFNINLWDVKITKHSAKYHRYKSSRRGSL